MAIAIFGLGTGNWSTDAADRLAASKQEHGYSWSYSQDGTVAADIAYAGPLRAAGALMSFEAGIVEAIATGADRTVNVDLKVSTGAGAFGTALSATIQFTNGSSLRATSAATISNTTLADGDWLSINVTVAGAAGAQAMGLVCRVVWRETWV